MKFNKVLILAALLFVIMSMRFVPAGTTFAQDQSSNQSEIIAKLDQVLNGQKAVMEQIASMKEEINIIKIRVTQIQ